MLLHPFHYRFHMPELFPVHCLVCCLADSQVIHDNLGVQFIHGHCGRKNPASHIGNLSQFQKPLDGTVLPVQAVKDREYHIHSDLADRISVHKEDALLRGVRQQKG